MLNVFLKEMAPPSSKLAKRLALKTINVKEREINNTLDHELEVLDKSDAASSALNNKSYDKLKATLEEGTSIISIKAIKLADKCNFG